MADKPPPGDSTSNEQRLHRALDPTQTADLQPTIMKTFQDAVSTTGIPRRLGQYTIKRTIASGGMGTVYEAIQEKPRRSVAIKVMKHGIFSAKALRRFEYEAELLGRLRHPNIAQIYEAGTHESGTGPVPYFAMEYIPHARLLTQFVHEKRLTTRERLALFIPICEGVHHGHQKGIIHRDLKPGNILVDQEGRPKIIDFGVARSTDSDTALTTMQTDVGQLIGTLQYMSPEQCAGDPHDIDIRSDVYALGVVFYEMLCERLPYEIKGTAIHEATRLIREQDPAKLGTADNTLRGDIETIALKALEKDRDRRYQSAADLAQDIRRYLNNEAISARPPSLTYQIRVFTRRHKAGCGAVAAIFVSLVVGVIVSTSLYLQAEKAREQAEARRVEAEEVTRFLYRAVSSVDPAEARGREFTVKEMVDQAANHIGEAFRHRPLAEASLRQVFGNTYRALGKYTAAEQHLRTALKLFRQRLTDEHLDVASVKSDLAAVYYTKGDLEAAERLWREALETRRKSLGEEHELVVDCINNLGSLFWQRRDYASAERLWRKASESRRKALGSEHPSVADSLNGLAAILQQKGEYAEAELMFEQSLDIRRRVFDYLHPDIAESLNNLAALLMESHHYERAKPLLAEALHIYHKLHENEHTDIARSLANMAEAVAKGGDPAAAEPLARQAVEMQRKLVGADHIETALMLVTLGEILIATGKGSQAESALRNALQNLRKVLPQGHYVRLVGESLLGASLSSQGKQTEAEPLLVGSFEALSGGRGVGDKYTLEALRRVVVHFERIGESDKAERYRALEPADRSP